MRFDNLHSPSSPESFNVEVRRNLIVNILPMPNINYIDQQNIIKYLIDNTVTAYTNTMGVSPF